MVIDENGRSLQEGESGLDQIDQSMQSKLDRASLLSNLMSPLLEKLKNDQ